MLKIIRILIITVAICLFYVYIKGAISFYTITDKYQILNDTIIETYQYNGSFDTMYVVIYNKYDITFTYNSINKNYIMYRREINNKSVNSVMYLKFDRDIEFIDKLYNRVKKSKIILK